MDLSEKISLPGPYKPTLILHGGAGAITRKNLPPMLYRQYEASLLGCLRSTRQWLSSGASALDAAVHAVSLMEDDPLFNCGRGSVFTEKGTIEMEASVMVASVCPDRSDGDDRSRAAEQKRGASVSLLRNTRHPIQLAKEVLIVQPNGKARSMHCQLSGSDVEEWGWGARGLRKKDDDWFWTKKRWMEHKRQLQKDSSRSDIHLDNQAVHVEEGEGGPGEEEYGLPSQGTVGAVCMDSWGDLAVATSTGGLTNKKVGRIGDTPTLGAGFWAESWEESAKDIGSISAVESGAVYAEHEISGMLGNIARAIDTGARGLLEGCLPPRTRSENPYELLVPLKSVIHSQRGSSTVHIVDKQPRPRGALQISSGKDLSLSMQQVTTQRRACALSGTGNGDTFLRTAACRTAAAMCRFSNQDPMPKSMSLATAIKAMAGPHGEMERSAGDRWKVTGEGQAGIIGIEVFDFECATAAEPSPKSNPDKTRGTGRLVSDFNCGGLFRAWIDEETGKEKVMVFHEEF